MNDSTTTQSLSSPPITPTNVTRSFVGAMCRPGQPGALSFDGKKVSDFLRDWNAECEEYGLTDAQKCGKMPRYCTEGIRESVENLEGCKTENWAVFKEELKKLFWEADPPRNTFPALVKLINEAKEGKMPVNVYVLNYTTITNVLVASTGMSRFDQSIRLLEGLSEELRSKMFKYCSEKGWRLFAHDVEAEEPDFEELKKVVLEKAKMMKKRKMFESGSFAGLGNPEKLTSSTGTLTSSTPATSTTVTTVPTALTSPRPAASDSEIAELTKQLSNLALFLQGQPRQQPTSSTMPTTGSELQPRIQREPRCIYCDSMDHVQRWRCGDLKEAMDSNVVGYNTKGRLMYIPTGEEIPANFGRGGMKVWVQTKAQEAAGKVVMMANVGTITFDDGSAGYGK